MECLVLFWTHWVSNEALQTSGSDVNCRALAGFMDQRSLACWDHLGDSRVCSAWVCRWPKWAWVPQTTTVRPSCGRRTWNYSRRFMTNTHTDQASHRNHSWEPFSPSEASINALENQTHFSLHMAETPKCKILKRHSAGFYIRRSLFFSLSA